MKNNKLKKEHSKQVKTNAQLKSNLQVMEDVVKTYERQGDHASLMKRIERLSAQTELLQQNNNGLKKQVIDIEE